ncbi:hypothetical protein GCM10023144_18020 [Pigmentiphaga soli]|uniref:Uncharacterized protein n=1 Tax=Pigmentiphaga soli TaxID=1007095 RepID=A0ABP8GVK1_9BURK
MTSTWKYTLYAAHGRIYAENVDGKLIDIGALHQEGGSYGFRLDTDNVRADGFDTPEQALRAIGSTVTLPYLDGQFTALADARREADLQGDVPRAVIVLSEHRAPAG